MTAISTGIPSEEIASSTSLGKMDFVDSEARQADLSSNQVELRKPPLMSKEKWEQTVAMIHKLQEQVDQKQTPPNMDPEKWKKIISLREKALSLLTPEGQILGKVGGQRFVGLLEYNRALRLIAQADQEERPDLDKARADAVLIAEHALNSNQEILRTLQERVSQIPVELTNLDRKLAEIQQRREKIEQDKAAAIQKQESIDKALENAKIRLYGDGRAPGSEALFQKKDLQLREMLKSVPPKDLQRWIQEYEKTFGTGSFTTAQTPDQVAGSHDQLYQLFAEKKRKIRFFRKGRFDKDMQKIADIRDTALSVSSINTTYRGDLDNISTVQKENDQNKTAIEMLDKDIEANQLESQQAQQQKDALLQEQRNAGQKTQELTQQITQIKKFLGIPEN